MKKKYDYIIVGAGLFGAICARELTDYGKKVLVIEKRNHIGGNCYSETRQNINIHLYGPHIFHTSNKIVWDYINRFCEFNNFILSPLANFKNEIFSLPFNMWTFNKMWGCITPDDAMDIIKKQSEHIITPKNLEEQAIKLVGVDIYEKLIKGYTQKQWKKEPCDLPSEIIKRLPVRFNYDTNYFNDLYQGIPIGGYTKIFNKMLYGIDVLLNTDYLNNKDYFNNIGDKIIYSGPIDKYYDYEFGMLEYKTTHFEHNYIPDKDNFQGCAIINYTDFDIKHTRIIEHKHFEKNTVNGTWITYEYPIEFIKDITEPYYPVNDFKNNEIYNMYKKRSIDDKNIFFGGRLGEYKYYDMDKVIYSAINFVEKIKNENPN
jgi:UDP-galactopyranose mutase